MGDAAAAGGEADEAGGVQVVVRVAWGVAAAEGWAAAVGAGVVGAVGAAPVGSGWLARVGVLSGGRGRVLPLALVMSRPARSMANHAVADTPATAMTQIAAMPATERMLITM
jgi:hypothetical protein